MQVLETKVNVQSFPEGNVENLFSGFSTHLFFSESI